MNLCNYGCGQEGKYQFKNGKWCCSFSLCKCPVIKENNRRSHKKISTYVETSVLCEYGCGKTAEYILPNKKYCCSVDRNKCESLKEKNRKGKVGRPIPEHQKIILKEKATGRKRSEESKKKQSEKLKELWNDVNSIYNDPIFLKKRASKSKISGVSFDIFEQQLSFCEELKRDVEDYRVLNVRCAYCGKWYRPEKLEVYNRVACLKNTDPNCGGESRFYCSEECKALCPIYKKISWPDGYSSRTEVNSQLRKIVFERDNWECQKCNSDKSLECHHIDPVSQEPFFANDPDSCITLCKECHKFVHTKIEGCKYNELRNC